MSTLFDPPRWLKSMEALHKRDPKFEVGAVDRQIVEEDCLVNAVYDLTASGLDEARITRAAHYECSVLEAQSYGAGYANYLANLSAEDKKTAQGRDDWESKARADTDDVIGHAFVQARAGQCWLHRKWTHVDYTPGT